MNFESEADLDAARPLIQRERTMLAHLIDLREIPKNCPLYASHQVFLVGGPYHGREAVVNNKQRSAWVIGDYCYELRCGSWQWSFDESC